MNRTSGNFKAIVAASIFGIGFVAVAQAMPQPETEETNILISTVEKSGCQFERNGTWHASNEAANHLRRKFKATEKKLQTTEQFIQYVASTSSLTKTPYRIRCGTETVEANIWLSQKLKSIRAGK